MNIVFTQIKWNQNIWKSFVLLIPILLDEKYLKVIKAKNEYLPCQWAMPRSNTFFQTRIFECLWLKVKIMNNDDI